MDIQQQQQQGKQSTGGQRPLSILPSSLQAVQAANIRAASSVSTQTVHGVQTMVHVQVTIISWKNDFYCCNFSNHVQNIEAFFLFSYNEEEVFFYVL